MTRYKAREKPGDGSHARLARLPLLRVLALLAVGVASCGQDDFAGPGGGRPAIEILIDDMGVPHVYGATDELAFYGAGYQMAADRLYQMECLRRFSLGRLSEVIGEAGLERDLQARTFDFPRWGRRDHELTQVVDPERVRLVSAWRRGINRRIAEVRSGLVPLSFGYRPGEMDFLPEPWDEADPYIILKGANFALDKTVEFEVAVSILSLLYPQAMAAVEIVKPAHPVYALPPGDRPPAAAVAACGPFRSGTRGAASQRQSASRSPLGPAGTLPVAAAVGFGPVSPRTARPASVAGTAEEEGAASPTGLWGGMLSRGLIGWGLSPALAGDGPTGHAGLSKTVWSGSPVLDRGLPLSSLGDRPGRFSSGCGPSWLDTGLAPGLASWPRPTGSNNFAVDGRFTRSGRPLLAGDPHLGFDFFGAPYPLHINSADAGGSYDVIGFAYPGTPGIALGHNRRVMWAVTSAFPDVNDVWNALKLDDRVLVGDRWVRVSRRPEEIVIRKPGGPAGQGRVKRMVYEDVEGYGVILPAEVVAIPVGGPYLMNWTGFKARPARWFMELNRADSLDAFEAAVDRMREMTYNFLGADATGIAYRVGVEVPLRRDTAGRRAPWKAMLSWDPGSLWTGETLAAGQLPHSRGLDRGWLATANNDPFGFTGDGRVDNDPWYYGSLFDPGYRAHRITHELERLTGRGDLAREDLQGLQTDLHSTLAEDLLPLLAAAYARVPEDEELARFRDRPGLDALVDLLTRQWDGRMARDSAGALAFQCFLHALVSGALRDDISLAYDFAMSLQAIFVIKVGAMLVGGAYPEGDGFLQGGRDAVILTAASRTAEWLERTFGGVAPPAYRYADRKKTRFDDALGYGLPVFSKPTDGGEDTVNVSQNISFSETAAEWLSSYVPVERSVGSFSEDGTPEAFVNFPLGAHADPQSADTAIANEDYVEGRYRKLRFERREIEAALRERIVLTPE